MIAILGAGAAIMAWLGWFEVAPALRLPMLGAAALINRDVASDENPGFWLGWLLLLLGLAVAAGVYLFVAGRFVRATAATGVLYGLVLWLVAGALIMPLLAWAEPAGPPAPPLPPGTPPPPQPPDPMHPSFMMLGLTNWAPVCAAIAWLLFGAILGAISLRMARKPT